MARGPVVGVQRGEANELKNTCVAPMTATVWSTIFNLTSFRMPVNQMEVSVLVADVSDVGVNE